MMVVQFKRAALVATVASLVAGAFLGGRVWAMGIPTTGALTYSGSLEDAAGTALTGSHNIQISFWGAASGGTTPLCQTASAAVTLEPQGRFTVALPDTCTAAVRGTPNVWAEVTADGLPLGRSKLGAVPYALEAAAAIQGAVRVNGNAKQASKVCAGETTAGSTAWTVYTSSPAQITTTVDISSCGFTAAPVVTSSLAGTGNHWVTTGGAAPYGVSATSFDIYINNPGGVTPAAANANNWHVTWVAVGN